MTDQRLRLIQSWMTSVITEHGTLDDKLQFAAERHGVRVDEIVRSTPELSAKKRIGIYANGYVLRLLECMNADFPVLHAFVGESAFDAFARAYIITEPPHSPSLYDLSAGFARFLEITRPKVDTGNEVMAASLELPPEIARIERARAEVMRARGTENERTDTDPLASFGVFNDARPIQAAECLRLLELKFPLIDFMKNLARAETPDLPPRRVSYLAVSRSNYRIKAIEIKRWQFDFLKSCFQPTTLNLAVRQMADDCALDPSVLYAELMLWLPIAFGLGYLRRHSTDKEISLSVNLIAA